MNTIWIALGPIEKIHFASSISDNEKILYNEWDVLDIGANGEINNQYRELFLISSYLNFTSSFKFLIR